MHDVKYSPAGDQFMVISGTCQAKIYDRDGEEKCVSPFFCAHLCRMTTR